MECMFHTYTFLTTDGVAELEKTEYFVDEATGFVEICASITTSCSVCPLIFNGDITLSLTPVTATSNYIILLLSTFSVVGVFLVVYYTAQDTYTH